MPDCFSLMTRHLLAPREDKGLGRVVLSRLDAGESPLEARSPSVKMVLDGEAHFHVGGRTWRAYPGTFLYVDGSEPCWGMTRSRSVALCVLLPREKTQREALPTQRSETMVGGALLLSSRTSAMGRALAAVARQIDENPAAAEGHARSLLAYVTQAIREPVGESRMAMAALGVAKESTRRDLFQRLERARSHLHGHADRSVALAELSQVAGLSQFHLARYFKLAFKATPMAYHRALRLENGARLLMLDHSPLAEIAAQAGYSDEVAFSHAFRRHFGASPRSWVRTRRVA